MKSVKRESLEQLARKKITTKLWRLANPEKVKEYSKKYRRDHPEKTIEQKKRARESGKTKAYMDEYNEKYRIKNGFSLNYKKKLKKREKFEKIAGRERSNYCEICGMPETRTGKNGTGHSLMFDHCHETGRFRGWICFRCNTTLGKVEDSVDLLLKMIDYLKNGKEHDGDS